MNRITALPRSRIFSNSTLTKSVLKSSELKGSRLPNSGLIKAETRALVTASKPSCKPTNNQQCRFHSNGSNNNNNNNDTLKVDDPQLMIAFTCKKCDTRSSHTFSKQAYLKGTVLIQCPGCKNRHLIADNLNIFKDHKFSLEEVLKAKGESVATTTEDLAFTDIPETLRNTIGHYAKDAPEEYRAKDTETGLPEGQEDGKHGKD